MSESPVIVGNPTIAARDDFLQTTDVDLMQAEILERISLLEYYLHRHDARLLKLERKGDD